MIKNNFHSVHRRDPAADEPRAYTYIRHRMAIEKAYSSYILNHHHALETREKREVRTIHIYRGNNVHCSLYLHGWELSLSLGSREEARGEVAVGRFGAVSISEFIQLFSYNSTSSKF
jgi:hypothetical protein